MAEFESPRFADDPLLVEILNDPDTGTKKLQPGSPAGSVRTLQQALFDLEWNLRTPLPHLTEPGEFVDGAAVVDGNMVSCRGWGDLAEWSRAFLDVLDRAAVPA